MSWCTGGVGLQVLPFIDNRHLGGHFSLSSNVLFLLTKEISEKNNNTFKVSFQRTT